jgi:hypothetical protein
VVVVPAGLGVPTLPYLLLACLTQAVAAAVTIPMVLVVLVALVW